MNLNTIIDACSADELLEIMEAIYLKNKRQMCIFLSLHDDLLTPPVSTQTPEPEPDISNERKTELIQLCKDCIVLLDEGAMGAPLETVFSDTISVGFQRVDVERALTILLDEGVAYEPAAGRIKMVVV